VITFIVPGSAVPGYAVPGAMTPGEPLDMLGSAVGYPWDVQFLFIPRWAGFLGERWGTAGGPPRYCAISGDARWHARTAGRWSAVLGDALEGSELRGD
jgi:hypothetical protein